MIKLFLSFGVYSHRGLKLAMGGLRVLLVEEMEQLLKEELVVAK